MLDGYSLGNAVCGFTLHSLAARFNPGVPKCLQTENEGRSLLDRFYYDENVTCHLDFRMCAPSACNCIFLAVPVPRPRSVEFLKGPHFVWISTA